MCGIAGIILKDSLHSKDLVSSLVKMSEHMHHRGPDDEGILLSSDTFTQLYSGKFTNEESRAHHKLPFINTNSIENVNVGICHRRLSILDLSTHGHQPMATKDKRYWISFNGEVYNFQEIKKDLQIKGIKFNSNTDTEVVLHAYLAYGENCLSLFNGMFAFVVFDTVTKNIFIARDRLGIKPLYYYHDEHIFLFASDIKTLLSSGLIESKVNQEGLYHNLTLGITPRPMTTFNNIYSFEPSKYYSFATRNIQLKGTTYWEVPSNNYNYRLKEKECIELVNDAVEKAVRRRMISDVPVGSFMSGGIDSTLVSSIAAKLSPNIKAYTLGYDNEYGSEFNELDLAKKNADLNNINHQIKIVKPEEILSKIDLILKLHEEPYYAISPNVIICDFVKKDNTTVVLNGLGGDELFTGYEGYMKYAFLYDKIKSFSFFHHIIPSGLSQTTDNLKHLLSVSSTPELYTTLLGIFNEPTKKSFYKGNYTETYANLATTTGFNKKTFNDIADEFSYLNLKSYVGDHHLYRMDQFTMHYSIEGRFPLLDHQLIELSSTIPTKFKVKNGIYKYILKQVARNHIHKDCIDAPKKGFSFPLKHWMEHELKELVNENLNDLNRRNIFDKINYSNLSYEQRWHLVMTELWLKEFIK